MDAISSADIDMGIHKVTKKLVVCIHCKTKSEEIQSYALLFSETKPVRKNFDCDCGCTYIERLDKRLRFKRVPGKPPVLWTLGEYERRVCPFPHELDEILESRDI
jgi:hypothetical protein